MNINVVRRVKKSSERGGTRCDRPRHPSVPKTNFGTDGKPAGWPAGNPILSQVVDAARDIG